MQPTSQRQCRTPTGTHTHNPHLQPPSVVHLKRYVSMCIDIYMHMDPAVWPLWSELDDILDNSVVLLKQPTANWQLFPVADWLWTNANTTEWWRRAPTGSFVLLLDKRKFRLKRCVPVSLKTRRRKWKSWLGGGVKHLTASTMEELSKVTGVRHCWFLSVFVLTYQIA